MLEVPSHIPVGDIEYLFTVNQVVIENEAKLATLAMKPSSREELLELYNDTFDTMMSEAIASYYKGEIEWNHTH